MPITPLGFALQNAQLSLKLSLTIVQTSVFSIAHPHQTTMPIILLWNVSSTVQVDSLPIQTQELVQSNVPQIL